MTLSLPTQAKVYPLITLVICISIAPILQIQCNNNSVSLLVESDSKLTQSSQILGAEGQVQIWTGNWTNFRRNNLKQLVFTSNSSPRQNVNIYTGKNYPSQSNVSWVSSYANKVWNYMTETYGNFGPDPYLNIVIHRRMSPPGVQHMFSLTPTNKISSNLSNNNNSSRNYNILMFNSNTGTYLSNTEILNNLAYFVEFASNNRLGSPSNHIWKRATTGNDNGSGSTVSNCSAWCDIFTYDIYNKLSAGTAKPSLADIYESSASKKWSNYPKKNTYWFKNWFLPIYATDTGTRILKRYFEILNISLPTQQQGNSYNRTLNIGEFVHFWSAAAKMDLRSRANTTFGWNSTFEKQFEKARKEFNVSALEYKCTTSTCIDDIVDSKPPVKGAKNDTDNLRPSLATTAKSEKSSTSTIIPVAGVFILITGIVIATACAVYHQNVHSLLEKTRELTDDEINTFFKGNLSADETSPGYGFIESQPFNVKYEIPSNQLQIVGTKLGSGAFGIVLSGTLKGSDEPGSRTAVDVPVAVKTVKPHVDVSIFLALLTEMKVMCFVGKHPHIVALHGAQTTKIRTRQVYIALEFCANGDLLNFLKKHRTVFKDLIGDASIKNAGAHNPEAVTTTELPGMEMTTISISEQPSVSIDAAAANQSAVISTLDLFKWSRQIASGMEFLGSKNVIHGDLAARNVLLTAEKTAKISDFGLSRQLYNYSTYVKKSKTPLPWNYLAIESLRDMEFSVQSDVWAFGVTLFEIFSLGTIPYAGRSWTIEFVDDLVAGLRLNAPKFGNDDVFNLMMDCMKLEPSDRIKFPEMGHRLIGIQRKLELKMNPGTLCNYVIT